MSKLPCSDIIRTRVRGLIVQPRANDELFLAIHQTTDRWNEYCFNIPRRSFLYTYKYSCNPQDILKGFEQKAKSGEERGKTLPCA